MMQLVTVATAVSNANSYRREFFRSLIQARVVMLEQYTCFACSNVNLVQSSRIDCNWQSVYLTELGIQLRFWDTNFLKHSDPEVRFFSHYL